MTDFSFKKYQASANSGIICKNMHFISNFNQWEHFSEKGVIFIKIRTEKNR